MTKTTPTIPSGRQLVAQAQASLRQLQRILSRRVAGDTTDLATIAKAETVRDSLPPLSYLPPALAARLAFVLGRLQAETGGDLTPLWDSRVPGPLATITRAAAERVLESTMDLERLADAITCGCEGDDTSHAYPPPAAGDADRSEAHRCDTFAVQYLRAELAGEDPGELPPLPDHDSDDDEGETPEAYGVRLARRDWPEGQTRSDLQGEVMVRYDIADPRGDAALDAYDEEWARLAAKAESKKGA